MAFGSAAMSTWGFVPSAELDPSCTEPDMMRVVPVWVMLPLSRYRPVPESVRLLEPLTLLAIVEPIVSCDP